MDVNNVTLIRYMIKDSIKGSFMLLSFVIVPDILHILFVVKLYRKTQILVSEILQNLRIFIDPVLPLIHPPKNPIILHYAYPQLTPQLTHLLPQIVHPLSHKTHIPPQIVQLLVKQHP